MIELHIVVNATVCTNKRAKSSDDMAAEKCIVTVQQIYCDMQQRCVLCFGAVQFGVQTAVALPVESPSVGRIVLILYSKYDRKPQAIIIERSGEEW